MRIKIFNMMQPFYLYKLLPLVKKYATNVDLQVKPEDYLANIQTSMIRGDKIGVLVGVPEDSDPGEHEFVAFAVYYISGGTPVTGWIDAFYSEAGNMSTAMMLRIIETQFAHMNIPFMKVFADERKLVGVLSKRYGFRTTKVVMEKTPAVVMQGEEDEREQG